MDKDRIIKSLYQLEEAIISGQNISDIILQAKVVASRLGSDPLKAWCHNELNGYHGVDNIPDYRVIESFIELRYMANHYGSTISDTIRAYRTQLPLEYHEQFTEENLNTIFTFRINNSIPDLASIQEELRSGERVLARPLESDIGKMFLKIGGYVYKEEYYIVCEGSQCASIVDRAKSHLLDITLSLQEEIGSASDFINAKEQAEELKRIANQAVTKHIYGEVKSMGDYYNQKAENIQNNQRSKGDNSMNLNSPLASDVTHYKEELSKMLISLEEETYENLLANQEMLIGIIKRIEIMEERITDKILNGDIVRDDLVHALEPIWESHVKNITDPKVKKFLEKHGPGMALKLGMKRVL